MEQIIIENEIVYQLFQKIKEEIFNKNKIMMTDEELLLFLIFNNKEINVSLK